MTRLAILGAGDLGQLLAHHASGGCGFDVVGFFDDTMPLGAVTAGGPVLGAISDVRGRFAERTFDQLLMGVGYKHLPFRWTCFTDLSRDVPFATLIHPSCSVDSTARIAPGSVLLAGCVLDRAAIVGANSLLNTGCVVAHDTAIGDNCFLGPGVCLAGFVSIGRHCFLGVGTVVIDSVQLADSVQTGGGAVVVDSLSSPGLYVGVPARRLR